MKYNFSISRRAWGNKGEVFQVVNCDSFDEAIKAVEKGIYERELKEKEENTPKNSFSAPSQSTVDNSQPPISDVVGPPTISLSDDEEDE